MPPPQPIRLTTGRGSQEYRAMKAKGLLKKWRGWKLLSRDGGEQAHCKGSYPCPRRFCTGYRLVCRWPDGQHTCPCTCEGVRRVRPGILQLVNAAPHYERGAKCPSPTTTS